MAFMQQSACLVHVFKPITVDNFAALFSCTPVDQASGSMMARPKAINFSWLGPELFCLLLVHRGSSDGLHFLQISSYVVWQTRDLHLSHNTLYLLSPCLCFFIVLKCELSVYRDGSFTR